MFSGEPSAASEPRHVRVLNTQIDNECTIQEVFCLRRSRLKNVLFYLLNLLTLGFVWLLCYWSNNLNRRLRYEYCELGRATHFQFLNWDDHWEIVRKEVRVALDEDGEPVSRVSFCNRFISYYYEPDKEVFCTARYQLGERLDELANGRLKLLKDEQRRELLLDFGRNLIEIPVRSKIKLFLAEMLSPFEVFQFYAIVLWLCEGYYIFPLVLIVASLFTYVYNVQLLQQAQRKLKEDSEIRVSVDLLKLTRAEVALEQHVDSERLVPGDLFYIKEGGKVPCDCVVLTGAALVNQNYITGDSSPIRKVCIQNFVYRSDQQQEFTLYMGTEVMEVQAQTSLTNTNRLQVPVPAYERHLLCLATRTNYYSLRGQYLRSILFPKAHSFQFYSESIKFIVILLSITLAGYVIVCVRNNDYLPPWSMFVTLLDLVSTSIPPTLPTAMSVGIGFAIQRLSEIGIKCTLPQKILVGGQVETVCFEKTGTLTKKEVSVKGFALCQNGRVTGILTSPQEIKHSRYAQTAFEVMSCCHSVSRSSVKPGHLGKPIDTAMLEFSRGVVLSNSSEIQLLGRRIRLLKRFEFTHLNQRMGVVVMSEDSERKLLVKGDPSRVIANCRPETVPSNIHDYINKQSEKGFKLMGLSARSLPDPNEQLDGLKRLERDMLFLGVLILENSLQATSEQTVRTLLASNARVVVISGDSELTSGAVAFGCGMLDCNELVYCDLQTDSKGRRRISMSSRDGALQRPTQLRLPPLESGHSGQTNEELQGGDNSDEDFLKEFLFALDEQKELVYGMTGRLFEELYMKRSLSSLTGVFQRTILFSRMLPKHKAALLEHYSRIGQVTALVGENTRDASTFRQADLSLALTSGEMSSFAHFSSLNSRLPSVVDLLRVCRAGLSTNFQTFKMMCQFSLMEFTTMVVLYLNYEELNNTESLYVDLFVMCPIFVTLSMTEPCSSLSKYVPPASLFSKFNLLSMLGLFLIQLVGQIIIVERLKRETFYTDSVAHKIELLTLNHSYNDSMLLSSTLFIFTNFLYMGVVIATSISKPFRKEFYTNPYLVANVLLITVYNFAIPFAPQIVPKSMGIDQSNPDWYVFVVFWANIICVVMYVYERVLVWLVEKFPDRP